MTSTRDRLEGRRSRGRSTRRRWPAWRVVLLVLGIVVALLGVAAGLAWWLLPPVIAEIPRERFTAPTAVVLQDAAGTATVTADEGWLAIGVGPFLPTDSAAIVSPDDAYRADLALLPDAPTPASTTGPGPTSAPEATGEPVPDADPGGTSDRSSAISPAATVAPETTADPAATADPFAELLAAHDLTTADLDAAGWHAETLTAGVDARYATVAGSEGAPDRAVTVVTPVTSSATGSATPDSAAAPGALVLIATTPAGESARYRPVTAALVATAEFAATAPTPSALDRVADFGALARAQHDRSPRLDNDSQTVDASRRAESGWAR